MSWASLPGDLAVFGLSPEACVIGRVLCCLSSAQDGRRLRQYFARGRLTCFFEGQEAPRVDWRAMRRLMQASELVRGAILEDGLYRHFVQDTENPSRNLMGYITQLERIEEVASLTNVPLNDRDLVPLCLSARVRDGVTCVCACLCVCVCVCVAQALVGLYEKAKGRIRGPRNWARAVELMDQLSRHRGPVAAAEPLAAEPPPPATSPPPPPPFPPPTQAAVARELAAAAGRPSAEPPSPRLILAGCPVPPPPDEAVAEGSCLAEEDPLSRDRARGSQEEPSGRSGVSPRSKFNTHSEGPQEEPSGRSGMSPRSKFNKISEGPCVGPFLDPPMPPFFFGPPPREPSLDEDSQPHPAPLEQALLDPEVAPPSPSSPVLGFAERGSASALAPSEAPAVASPPQEHSLGEDSEPHPAPLGEPFLDPEVAPPSPSSPVLGFVEEA